MIDRVMHTKGLSFTNISVFVVTTNQTNKAEVDNKLVEKI